LELQQSSEVTSVTADTRPIASAATDLSAEIARLNEEVRRVAARAMKLGDVVTDLSEARSVEDVARVVLTKGMAIVEAARGLLVLVEGDRLKVLGSRGFSPGFETRLSSITRDSEIPIVHALRKGEMIWIESSEEFRDRYAAANQGFAELADMQTYVAAPLIHGGETVGAMALHFREAAALGAADRTFTLLLAQATATALYRARVYDAEQEKRRHAELVAQAREDVLGVVAHDLRNPLSLIVTSTELLLEEDLEPAKRRQILEIAMRAGKQMNRLIEDLLDTVQLDSGKFSLDLEDVEVVTVFRQAEETFLPLAHKRQIHLTAVAPDGVCVWADSFRLSQLLGNLLGNAIKFTPEGGAVTFRATQNGREVEFDVSDNGPGVPPEQIDRIFDQFWQARKADKRGVGLGLTIAKGIVDAHGGRIWCQSAPGHGSTFSFTLPAGGSARHQVPVT
jgi:signal transduction histidine kinase